MADEFGDLETERILATYNARFQPHEYQQVFYLPRGGPGKVDALFPEGYFQAARVLLEGVVGGRLAKGTHGVAAIFLSRHYLELALKYALFHSRWLRDEKTNTADSEVESVGSKGNRHRLQTVWDKLLVELTSRTPSMIDGFDQKFIAELVKEFHEVDPYGTLFRYPAEELAVGIASVGILDVDFTALQSNLQHAHDVLSTLDNSLLEQYGQNQDWENEVRSW